MSNDLETATEQENFNPPQAFASPSHSNESETEQIQARASLDLETEKRAENRAKFGDELDVELALEHQRNQEVTNTLLA